MKRQCCWAVSLWAALCGSACGDSSGGSGRATDSVAMPALPAAPTLNAGSAAAPPGPGPAAAAAGNDSAMAATPAPVAATETPANPSTPAAGSAGAASSGMQMMPPAGASFPGESCDGCARFFLPMTAENQRGDFELDLAAPIDMTGATLRFRLLAAGFKGNAGGVSVYVRDANNYDKGFVWTNLTALSSWTDVAVDFATALAGNMSFDVSKVAKIGVQLNSAGTFAGANYQSATLYLDSVRFSNAPAADLTFTDGIGDLALVSADAPAGTSVNFLTP